MGITDALFMALGHTLLIIQNKHFSRASFKDGVPSEFIPL
jgi:hypothetical protein